MRNVLSQTEIDLLVKAVSSGEMSLDEIITEQQKTSVRKYDFRRPNKFSKTHINALSLIHQNFGRILSSYLSAFLRSSVDIKVASVEQLTFEDYIVSVDTTLAILFDINQAGTALMELSLPIFFPILELMLGGNGSGKTAYRPLTELELSVVQKLSDRIIERYSMVWNETVEVTMTKQALESNPRLIYTISPNEIVVLITYSAHVNNFSGLINVCLPFTVIESLLGSIISNFRSSNIGKERVRLIDNQGQLRQCQLPFRAVAGKIPMRVKDLMELEAGDVVFIERSMDDNFELLVCGKPLYQVQAGVLNGRKAVRIVSVDQEVVK